MTYNPDTGAYDYSASRKRKRGEERPNQTLVLRLGDRGSTRPTAVTVNPMPRRYYRRRTSSSSTYRPRYRPSSRRYNSYRKPYRGPFAGPTNSNAPELKYVDVQQIYQPISYGDVNGSITNNTLATDPEFSADGTNTACYISPALNSLAQATTQSSRIGSKVHMKSILLQIRWKSWPANHATSATPHITNPQPVCIRTMLVLDTQMANLQPVTYQAGVFNVPLPSDILQAILHLQNNYVLPNSPNNLLNRMRFRTLMDMRDTLNPQGDDCRQYDKYIKLNIDTIFNNVITPTTNGLFLLLVTEGTRYTTTEYIGGVNVTKYYDSRPICQWHSRIRYTDA